MRALLEREQVLHAMYVAARMLAGSCDDRLPTAVFASNDRSAIGLLDAFRRAGLSMPDDISVAGYDDSLLAQLSHVDLTTVNQNPQRQADLAVRAAVAAISSSAAPPENLATEDQPIWYAGQRNPQWTVNLPGRDRALAETFRHLGYAFYRRVLGFWVNGGAF